MTSYPHSIWQHGRAVLAPAPRPARTAGKFDLVVMAASAGGLKAFEALLGALPEDFPLPIAIVQHRTARDPNLMARVLSRHTALPVKIAEAGERLEPGRWCSPDTTATPPTACKR